MKKRRAKDFFKRPGGLGFGRLEPAHRRQLRLWILRALLLAPDLSDFDDRGIFAFLGIEQKSSAERADEGDGKGDDPLRLLLSRPKGLGDSELRRELRRLLAEIAETKTPKDKTVLHRNLRRLAKTLGFSDTERELLEFAVWLQLFEPLQNATDYLGAELNSRQVMEALSAILERPFEEIRYAFSSESPLGGSALVTLNRRSTHYLKNKIDFFIDTLADRLHSEKLSIEEMLREIVHPSSPATLVRKDFAHLKKEIRLIEEYLADSMQRNRAGVNILLYGPPGTGKTELARYLAARCEAKLYEVSSQNEHGDSIDGNWRLKFYKGAQALLRGRRNLLLYDEAEDLFESSDNFFFFERQKDKAWINRTLERNPVPTIWITNRIESLDPAIVRRFDLSLELAIPPKKQRRKIIERYCGHLLNEKEIKRLARHPYVAPALVASAAKVAARLPERRRSKELTGIIDRTLRAQEHPPLKAYSRKEKKPRNSLPPLYDPALANIPTDPEALAVGLGENPNARLVFYGPPGTGKSALGRWLAKKLDRPVILKKASDLLSMWVGGTEKNIAAAFAEARKRKAVLIFDEVDSLLLDRRGAQRSWERTQVNEMLVQMEEFDGIFIATTNLMEGLDPASLRRFDMKLEFGWMRPDQVEALFGKSCRELGLPEPGAEVLRSLRRLSKLTPGDFAALLRRHRFDPIRSPRELAQRLEQECRLKSRGEAVMGFVG